MRLLFDENLSPRLVQKLASLFPDSQHVELAGLRGQPDNAIWDYAARHELAIVSKDNDFRQLSFLHGPPPKVIWLSVGNAGTDTIARLLEGSRREIEAFESSPDEALLVLQVPWRGEE
ncbi:MAG TPA: DUF5615 family PIN-like protein [Candidatus Sulfotelmatobacter sp.]|nr:DUF5615 family PIN-like protein [Candidatus Sulfotelmatobacter sp.]